MAITIAVQTGVLKRGDTSENLAGISLSKDHAKSFLVVTRRDKVPVKKLPTDIRVKRMAIITGPPITGAPRSIRYPSVGSGFFPEFAKKTAALAKLTPKVFSEAYPTN